MEFYAHIDKNENSIRRQTVAEHCRNTAKYASDCLKPIGLESVGYLCGLIHDLGKVSRRFSQYLTEETETRGSVIHSFQGCRMLLEHFHHSKATEYSDITSELIAYAVGAHHGLFDCIDLDGNSGLQHRMTDEDTSYRETVENFTAQCADWPEIEARFRGANAALEPIYQRLNGSGNGDEKLFYIGLLERMILSAVIEGDRRDTAEFMDHITFPDRPKEMRPFWRKYLVYMEDRLKEFDCTDEISRARQSISDQCRAFANEPGGIYQLSVPTGSGKTLSSLRFALAHAEKWGKQRIIFTAPLLTILDQNAKEIRKYIGDDSVILEHHSNVVRSENTGDQLDPKELLEENWGAPVVITSMVQLLNTMFSGRTGCIRRFQALCDSVIIIDEVQAVPNYMLSLFNLAVNFLSRFCRVTFVLCSATQPCFDRAEHPLDNGGGRVMVPYQSELWQTFRRTRMVDAGKLGLEEIPGFLMEKLDDVRNLLVVCNTKKQAAYLYRRMNNGTAKCFHLSAGMCMTHRKKVLEQVECALEESKKGGPKVILVSTQVIEAGVDISFECAVRLLAGLDNAVQTAGRCNRSGECGKIMTVYLIHCEDESLGSLREIQDAQTAAVALLEAYRRTPEKYHDDLASDAAVRDYYLALYRDMNYGYQDFTVGKDTLFSLLSGNTQYLALSGQDGSRFFLKQAFRTAGRLFQVFDEDTQDVVVPYGEGKKLIFELSGMGDYPSVEELRKWAERAKAYTVALYQGDINKIGREELYMRHGITVLTDGFYDENTGVTPEGGNMPFLEVQQ